MNTQPTTPTQLARLSVLELSLIYFIPLISLVSTHLAAGWIALSVSGGGDIMIARSSPLPSVITFCIVMLLFLLSIAGAARYNHVVKPRKKYILAATFSFVPMVLFLFWGAAGGFLYPNVVSGLSTVVYAVLPFVLFLYIPVWFTVPGLAEHHRIPQVLGVLTPFALLTPLLGNMLSFSLHLQIPGLAAVLLSFGVLISTLAGILLLLTGLHHPEISSS